MKIGLFFGTFNPIHIGHMVIANYLLEYSDLEKIWFVVTPHNPLKDRKSLLDDYSRLHLVNLAIGDDVRFRTQDIEFSLPQPNYTVNTLAYLKEKYPEHEFVLIMGGDNLKTFHKWKNHEEIINHYHIYVYKRADEEGGIYVNHKKVHLFDAPLMEISSTFIRKAIQEGKDVSYFLPKAVGDYIKQTNYYRN